LDRPNAVAYASLPRKYNPLKKLNTSPNDAPVSARSRSAKSNVAAGFFNNCARAPSQRAGDKRKT